MAVDFDEFPLYDPVINIDNSRKLSNVWRDSLATFYQSLIGYLTQNGIVLPNLTTDQRDAIQSPQNGQMIFNTSLNVAQIWISSASPQWQTVTTS